MTVIFMNPLSSFLTYANRLRFRNLFILTVVLFLFDLLVPDFIPLVDELLLGLLTILFANWKKPRPADKPGNMIEGEVIEGEVINREED